MLKRWQEGERSGRQLWREVRFQGYSGSERKVYRFLETLKTTEIVMSAGTHRLPHYTSTAAVWLFMRRPERLDEIQREDLAAFRLAQTSLNTTYQLVQDFLHMMRHRLSQSSESVSSLGRVPHAGGRSKTPPGEKNRSLFR